MGLGIAGDENAIPEMGERLRAREEQASHFDITVRLDEMLRALPSRHLDAAFRTDGELFAL